MKLSQKTLSILGKIITGDEQISPHRTGYDLVRFFNQFGFNDTYGQGFPSRWMFAEQKLEALSGTREMERVIQSALDPRDFVETEFNITEVIDLLNFHLDYDGYQVVKAGQFYKVQKIGRSGVSLTSPFSGAKKLTQSFIHDQIERCDQRISQDDFFGAITNSRSLIEAVLKNIETELDPDPPQYDGDLIKLYKRVQKLLNLDPSQKDLSDTLRQILSGMVSIVNGLAGLRNKMSDAHAPQYRPEHHHAKLAVNAAKTLVDFIFETYKYQQDRGKISSPTKET